MTVDNGVNPDYTAAADDIGGVHYFRTKLAVGADGTAVDVQPPDADAKAASSALPAASMRWNGTGWDRQRGNMEGALLASAARTTQTDTALVTNHNSRGVLLAMVISVASGTGGIRPMVLTSVDSQLMYLNSPAPAAITATGTYGYLYYPGATEADATGTANVQAHYSVPLPRSFYVRVLVGDASSYTYSLHYALIV